MKVFDMVAAGLRTGAVLSTTTTTAIGLAGIAEAGSFWTGINSITHIVDGDEKDQPVDWAARESLIGLAINCTAMGVWGILYEAALAVAKKRSSLGWGVLCAVFAYIIDYYAVPPRLAPGIEKRLSGWAVFATYLAMAVTLSNSSRWRKS